MRDTVFVIGSNSFSGAHFVRYALEKGMTVVGLSRSEEPHPVFLPYKWSPRVHPENFSFFQCDLNHDLDALAALLHEKEPAWVVNFASQSMVGQSWLTPEDWFMTNAVSTVKLHNILRECAFLKKYVHISTPEVYGSCQGLVKESEPYNPSTPYAVSRAAADMSLKTFFDNYQFPVVFTRAANVYGPGQQLYRIVPRAVLYFTLGRTLQLHGGGRSVRSFIHIRDVCAGTFSAMTDATPPGIYHFSTRENISIRDLVKAVAEQMNVAFDDRVETVADRPGKDLAYLLDSDRARTELGWNDRIGLEQGIQEVMGWVKENLDDLKAQPMDYVHKP